MTMMAMLAVPTDHDMTDRVPGTVDRMHITTRLNPGGEEIRVAMVGRHMTQGLHVIRALMNGSSMTHPCPQRSHMPPRGNRMSQGASIDDDMRVAARQQPGIQNPIMTGTTGYKSKV
jgi:hypothetical protein